MPDPTKLLARSSGRRRGGVFVLLVALILFGVWELSPIQAIQLLSSLTDPAKLATLGERGANERVNKIVFWLDEARTKGISPERAILWAQYLNGSKEPRASLVKEALIRNIKIADELLLMTPANRERLRRGHAAKIMRGPYVGETIEIDHIVPLSLAPEVGNELANLEMLPKTVNRKKSNIVTSRQVAHAAKLFEAGLLSRQSYDRVLAELERSKKRSSYAPF